MANVLSLLNFIGLPKRATAMQYQNIIKALIQLKMVQRPSKISVSFIRKAT